MCIVTLFKALNKLQQRLIDYLDHILGERIILDTTKPASLTALPLYLRERYQFMMITLFGQSWLLALAKDEAEAGSSQEYAQHAARIMASSETHRVIMVLPSLPSWTRNRLVRQRVAFIVPGNQMFLPPFTVDLRERAPLARKVIERQLTPSAQSVLLLHLMKHSLHEVALRDIAPQVGCTPMMISKVKDELAAAGLCDTMKKGRSIILHFPQDGRALWDKALPKLTSPVRKTYWVKEGLAGGPAPAAGLTALSQRTDISDDLLPTFALPTSSFHESLKRGVYHVSNEPEEADLRMECWAYNPMVLGDLEGVDPLSLYLSLRDSPDDRIQQQLEMLLEQVSW